MQPFAFSLYYAVVLFLIYGLDGGSWCHLAIGRGLPVSKAYLATFVVSGTLVSSMYQEDQWY